VYKLAIDINKELILAGRLDKKYKEKGYLLEK
jgi:hypothetical protein